MLVALLPAATKRTRGFLSVIQITFSVIQNHGAFNILNAIVKVTDSIEKQIEISRDV